MVGSLQFGRTAPELRLVTKRNWKNTEVDKPAGPTSADLVARVLEAVQGVVAPIKVGHGGTLDPFATGVLVLGIAKGTKMLQRFLHGGKEYLATVRMGTETSTQDAEGTVLRHKAFEQIQRRNVEEALKNFRGTIQQA